MKRLMAQLQSAQAQLASSARTSSKGDAQSIQQVLDILSEIVKKQAEPPAPIVIQQDPRFESLLQSLGVQLDRSNRVALDPLFVMVAVAVAFLLLVFTCLILIILVRARRRMARKESLNRETTAKIVQPEGSFALAPAKPALIGYSTSDGMDGARDIDTSLRKGLLRMERLQGMYDELRAGSLRWESVRANIDELGSALKTDILNLVEQKLDAGDLVSYEAVLPVIFPFLTDYDDFFREKADNLARAALVSNARQIEAAIAGPFELRELAQIPERLKLALKGADRSVITAKLSRAVAKRMGLSPSEREGVYKGALAHDVGYLTLDADRLHRVISRREITKEDMEFVKSHAVRGASFFGDASLPEYLREAILSHHERVDGSGYPRALAGEAIPLIARIIGASETFVSLISKRSYRDRFEVGQALAILKDGRGTKFDPAVVDALAAIAVHLEGAL